MIFSEAEELLGLSTSRPARLAVVIPCYRVANHVLSVISAIGDEVQNIYCIDDQCPEKSGDLIEMSCQDPRVNVIKHSVNRGVGGATKTGFMAAFKDGADVIVKLDGDGQMDPSLIPQLVSPILLHQADYVKGNRFYNVDSFPAMPKVRLFGNLGLSFLTKLSTGYWNQVDPTNGFVAISAPLVRFIEWEKINNRYFFETDMLFRLNQIRAVVDDIPMYAKYGNEKSNLSVTKQLPVFCLNHLLRLFKRLIYSYFLRDFNIGSVYLIASIVLITAGLICGLYNWHLWSSMGQYAPAGIVMFAALPIILGVQMLIGFLSFDIDNIPKKPITPYTKRIHRKIKELKVL